MEVGRSEMQDLRREVTRMGNTVSSLETETRHLRDLIRELVTRQEFFPVKMIAYGLAAGSMGAVITAVISTVIGR